MLLSVVLVPEQKLAHAYLSSTKQTESGFQADLVCLQNLPEIDQKAV